jgi:hypothetical protein
MRQSLYILIVLLAAASLVRGVEVTRTLKTFDFEERRLGNVGEQPMGWTKVAGPGLPHYLKGKLANDRKHDGDYSFRFDLDGGGLIYRYGPGLLKAQAGARYRIDAFCQTTPLPNARARMTAYFVDSDGHTMEKTIQHSELYAAQTDGEEWKKLSLSISDDFQQADSLVIELELLQPAQFTTSTLGAHALFEQDIHGSAWWDDVTIAQVPAVGMRTDRLVNIFQVGEPIRVSLLVSDRSTDDLVANVSVRDADGKEVYQRTGKPQLQPAESTEKPQKRMLLELPDLPPGWYQIRLTISSGGQSLEKQVISLVVLADAGGAPEPDPRFGFIATSLPFEQWGELPKLLRRLSAGRVKLGVWTERGDVEQTNGNEFDQILRDLREAGIAPTACLMSPPPKLRAKLGGADWARLSRLPVTDWQPDLAFLVSRHANHIENWQLGPDGSEAFATEAGNRDAYKRVLDAFSQLVHDPELATPWPAYFELPSDAPASIALGIPPSVLPPQIPLYLEEFKGKHERTVSVTLELIDRAQYGREAQISDLAKRLIYTLSADATRIDFPLPVTLSNDDVGSASEPEELLVVLRTMLATLSGASYRGRLPLAEGVEAFLFDRQGHGVIALWSRGDSAGPLELALNLGERPVRLDLWGHAAPLVNSDHSHGGRVLLGVDTMPIFLVDIDGHQAQLRASVGINQPLLESTFHPHERRIHFTNAYDHAISGTMHLHGPDAWTLTPPTFSFNLNPGETFDKPVTIQFPYNSVAGSKTLRCEFVLAGEKNPTFGVPLTLKLGLTDVGMQTLAFRDGHDILVQQMVTNYGDRPISYAAFATYPSMARQERVVTSLAPGATTIRRYRFANVPRTPDGAARVGLKELEGTRILNDLVAVE